MPAVKEFPIPREFGGPGGPLWESWLYHGPEYKVHLGTKYEDGSRDRNVEDTRGVHKWTINYDSLTEDEQRLLDEHYQSAVGPAYGFQFWDHRHKRLWSGVHYEEYKRDKGPKRTRGKRKVVLVWEPDDDAA